MDAIIIANIVKYASMAFDVVPKLIDAGMSIKAHVDETQAALKAMQDGNRDPTEQEWAALNAQVDALRAKLHSGNG